MKVKALLNRRHLLGAMMVAVAFAAACDDDPSAPVPGGGDPENISRVTIVLTPVGGGAAQTSFISDPDGTQLPDPPGDPQGTLTLTKGVTYNGTIAILNDVDPSDIVDVNEEISEEANFHRLFYTFSCAGVTVPVASLDVDTQTPTPQPLGLTYQVVVDAGAASTTTCMLHVELRHFESNKGDGTGVNYETDIALDFPVIIQA